MVDRRQIGSWLEGPGAVLRADDTGYPGQRLGLPETGPGALARTPRRLVALAVDWVASLLVAALIVPWGDPAHAVVTLAVFAVQVWIGLLLGGASFGHRLLGMRVARVDRRVLDPLRALGRVALLVLVIPALVTDGDGRGLHDRLVGTAVVRSH